MSKPDGLSPEQFLSAVQRQIGNLAEQEQGEILEELEAHIRDTEAILLEAGFDQPEAEARAVAAMGEPVIVGRRLRDEHLARGLPLREAMLTGLPLLLFPLLFLIMIPLIDLRSPLGRWLRESEPGLAALVLLPILGLCLWRLRRVQQYWMATLAGVLGVIGSATFTHAFQISSHWPLNGAWLLMALLAFPAILVVLVRWGSLRASLAILGGVGTYGLYACGGALSLWTLSICLVPCLGVVALGMMPHGWRFPAAWLVLATEWLVIVFYPISYVSAMTDPLEKAWLQAMLTPDHLLQMVSLPVLVISIGLLGWVHLLALLQSRGAIDHLTARIQRG